MACFYAGRADLRASIMNDRVDELPHLTYTKRRHEYTFDLATSNKDAGAQGVVDRRVAARMQGIICPLLVGITSFLRLGRWSQGGSVFFTPPTGCLYSYICCRAGPVAVTIHTGDWRWPGTRRSFTTAALQYTYSA